MCNFLELLRTCDVCRIVFRQCHGLSVIQELLSRDSLEVCGAEGRCETSAVLSQVCLIFEALESACSDKLTLDQIVASSEILERIMYRIQESFLSGATYLPAAATLLLRFVKDREGKEKVVTIFRHSYPSMLAEIIQLTCTPRTKVSDFSYNSKPLVIGLTLELCKGRAFSIPYRTVY